MTRSAGLRARCIPAARHGHGHRREGGCRHGPRIHGCDPADIRAAIGPCIGLCCFEVGPEVAEAMRAALERTQSRFSCRTAKKYHADLKGLNRLWLEQAGLRTIDTCGLHEMPATGFWSHRTVGSARGSQAGIIMIKE